MTDDLLEDETIGFGVLRGHQPTFLSVDQEIVRTAMAIAEDAREFAQELLTRHDEELGRTTLKNKMWAEQLEKSINQAKVGITDFRKCLGWPAK
jgi:cytochrome c-type biogenesis protein CcmE